MEFLLKCIESENILLWPFASKQIDFCLYEQSTARVDSVLGFRNLLALH